MTDTTTAEQGAVERDTAGELLRAFASYACASHNCKIQRGTPHYLADATGTLEALRNHERAIQAAGRRDIDRQLAAMRAALETIAQEGEVPITARDLYEQGDYCEVIDAEWAREIARTALQEPS